jgi:cell division topological specificity factor
MKFYRFFYKRHSKATAKDRLRVLLISDRINCSQETLELMKKEIAKVISQYMKIDVSKMDVQIKQDNHGKRNASLSATIPILDLYK